MTVCNSCMWWMQKGDPYAKLFSTVSGVILMYCILSQLNILCNNLRKPYFTKMTTHPLFTVHMLRPFHAFATYWIWSDRSNPYIKTFRPTAKRSAIVFRVHSRHVEFCWPTGVHSQQWLSILRQLCVTVMLKLIGIFSVVSFPLSYAKNI